MTTLDPEVVETIWGARRWSILEGDCFDVLDRMPSASVDAIVTDPPAGISFMGREWDSDKGGRDEWIHWLATRMRAAKRVLKPGGHALVWALPRTSHWTAMALENADFEIRDRITHIFGEGFPKSLNISKEILRRYPVVPLGHAAWDGWGTALKPACEDWWLARKPLTGTVVGTVLAHGTGALNIDACRVEHASPGDLATHANGVAAIKARGGSMDNSWKNSSDLSGASDVSTLGRWPAHLILTHGPDCKRVGTRRVKVGNGWYETDRPPPLFTGAQTSTVHHGDEDGLETIDAWECADGCPAKLLDEQSGVSRSSGGGGLNKAGMAGGSHVYGQWGRLDLPNDVGKGDEGGASRYFTQFEYEAPFFYTGKATRGERERGCEHLPARNLTGRKEGSAGTDSPRAGAGRKGVRKNFHPTVKSQALMRFLCRLVTPPNGIVLDLFAGSGSTLVACSAERFRAIGIELDPDSIAIARARFVADAPLLNTAMHGTGV